MASENSMRVMPQAFLTLTNAMNEILPQSLDKPIRDQFDTQHRQLCLLHSFEQLFVVFFFLFSFSLISGTI